MSISASLTHPDVETTQVSMNRWMDKEAVTHTHRGILFSHEKKKESLTFATTWINLEGILLSEISQT